MGVEKTEEIWSLYGKRERERERERERKGERRLWTYRLWGSWVQRQADVALGLKLGVITRLTFLPTQLSLKAFDAWILYISFLLTSSFHVFLVRGFRLKVLMAPFYM